MSGIITGPYFRKYFNFPGPIELGTVVAVLEIGAFSMFTDCFTELSNPKDLRSHFRRCRSSG